MFIDKISQTQISLFVNCYSFRNIASQLWLWYTRTSSGSRWVFRLATINFCKSHVTCFLTFIHRETGNTHQDANFIAWRLSQLFVYRVLLTYCFSRSLKLVIHKLSKTCTSLHIIIFSLEKVKPPLLICMTNLLILIRIL